VRAGFDILAFRANEDSVTRNANVHAPGCQIGDDFLIAALVLRNAGTARYQTCADAEKKNKNARQVNHAQHHCS
jgi:hypothetical protein